MICQNCQANVDNDLVFCTSCGIRLNETWNKDSTVLINESVATKTSIPPIQKTNSKPKWIALIIALIAIPAAIFGAYVLYNNSKQTQIAANQTKATNQQTASTNRQSTNNTPPKNSINTANAVNVNSNSLNVNTNSSVNSNANSPVAQTLDEAWFNEKAPAEKRTEIWSDRIGIAPEKDFAVPFAVEGDDQIVGNVKTLQGLPVEGYVYTQEAFDEHFPDPTFKMFSFGGEKNTKIDQTLVKGKYVLVFMNKSKTPLMIYGKVFTVSQ